jgi:hypothetical protein
MALKSASTYLEKKVLEHTLSVASFTMPATVYAALFKDNPLPDASGDEVVAGGGPSLGYQRKAMTFSTAIKTTSGNGSVIVNDGAVTFGPCETTAWGTITHAAIFDSAVGGNMLYYGPLSESKTIGITDTFTFPNGQYTITMD